MHNTPIGPVTEPFTSTYKSLWQREATMGHAFLDTVLSPTSLGLVIALGLISSLAMAKHCRPETPGHQTDDPPSAQHDDVLNDAIHPSRTQISHPPTVDPERTIRASDVALTKDAEVDIAQLNVRCRKRPLHQTALLQSRQAGRQQHGADVIEMETLVRPAGRRTDKDIVLDGALKDLDMTWKLRIASPRRGVMPSFN